MKSEAKATIVTLVVVGATLGSLVFSAGEALAVLSSRAKSIPSQNYADSCPAGQTQDAAGRCVVIGR